MEYIEKFIKESKQVRESNEKLKCQTFQKLLNSYVMFRDKIVFKKPHNMINLLAWAQHFIYYEDTFLIEDFEKNKVFRKQ